MLPSVNNSMYFMRIHKILKLNIYQGAITTNYSAAFYVEFTVDNLNEVGFKANSSKNSHDSKTIIRI